jgi:hypothetical protein
MLKFFLNLLVQISKAMVYSKIKFYSEKFFPVTSGPSSLSAQPWPILFFSFQPAAPPLPTGPRPHGRPSWPIRRWHPTELPPPPQEDASSRAAFALSSRPANRWTPPVIPHLWPARARPRRHHLPPLPAPPSPTSDATRAFTTPAINVAITPPATPLRCSPGPFKMAMRPPTLTAPHPLSPELFRALLHPRDELKPPPFVASGAPPLCHPSIAGENLISTASTGSSSPSLPASTGKLQRPRATRRRGAATPSVENLIRKSVILEILQRSPSGFPKFTPSP